MADLPPFVPSLTGGELLVTGKDTTIDTSLTNISQILYDGTTYETVDLGKIENFCLWVLNSGSTAFVECVLEQSPDGTNWEITNNTTFSTLGAGAIKSLENHNNSRKYLRVRARVGSGTTTAKIYVTGSV